MDKSEKLRPIGPLEQYSTCRHHLGFYTSVGVSASYTLPETSTLPVKDYVYRACETLIGQHPILSAVPFDEGVKDPYWVRLPEVNLDDAVSFQERKQSFPEGDQNDTELEALLNVQHNTPFPRGSAFWRLIILTEPTNAHRFTAAFVGHHAICDGTSAKAFQRTFHQALHTTPSQPKTNHVIPSPSTPLLPTLEDLHPLPLSLPYLATQIFKAKIWSPAHPATLWTGSKILSPSPSRIRQLTIPATSSKTLLHLSRKNSTTITATLQTTLARALFTHLPSKYTSLQCSGAISARRFLDNSTITNDVMGTWVQVYTQPYTRDTLNLSNEEGNKEKPTSPSSFPWQIATSSRQTITNKISENMKDSPIALLKYVDDFHNELCLSKVGKERDSGFEVTNVGAFDPLPPPPSAASATEDEEGRPRVGRMVFSQSASVIGCAVQVSVISGGDGCLSLVFSWQEGVVEDGLVERVIGMVEREIQGLCEAGVEA